jgi:hypothetical protein
MGHGQPCDGRNDITRWSGWPAKEWVRRRLRRARLLGTLRALTHRRRWCLSWRSLLVLVFVSSGDGAKRDWETIHLERCRGGRPWRSMPTSSRAFERRMQNAKLVLLAGARTRARTASAVDLTLRGLPEAKPAGRHETRQAPPEIRIIVSHFGGTRPGGFTGPCSLRQSAGSQPRTACRVMRS